MGAVGFGLQQLGSALVWQIISVIICIIVYFTVLLTCFSSARNELFSLPFIQKFIKKIKKK